MPRVGRYEIGPVIGEGGAGRVHRAERIGPGQQRTPVALKILHRGGSALRREARIGGLLRHRNLVDVYEVGEAEGTWFCAMELCAGSLSQHLPLPPRAVVEVGLQVCAALQYAHEALGLVHQDIKPANLLVDDHGVVKVADLGIARAEGFEFGEIRGTPGYVAPEQAWGGSVDARADIYALGVTLMELASGQRAGSSQTMAPDGDGHPAPDTQSTMSIDDLDTSEVPLESAPEWLTPVVERCLEHDPARRWPDMGALADALRSLQPEGPGLREVLGLHGAAPPGTGGRDDREGFVGRDHELALLAELLAERGLCTLLGPPGIGKSRLAAAAARQYRATHREEVCTCDLSEARTVDDLCATVARSLGVALAEADPVVQLGHVLARRGPVLLVLDSFEHLSPLADVVRGWSEQAAAARIVVTSRVATGLGRQVRIGPLSEERSTDLLAVRARQRGVELAGDPDLPELARRLDGVPLALELAAGRLGVLSVRDVLDRLDLSLLRGGTDDRHATLHSALDWSWTLLSEPDRQALAQLSVFAGGFTLTAAERVLELGDTPPLDAVASLVEHSMVATTRGVRLRLLGSVREYATEKLEDDGATERRHGCWCLGLVEAGDPLAPEIENLVAACRRAIVRGDGEVAVGTVEGAWDVLALTGPGTLPVEIGAAVDAMELESTLRARAALCHARALWAVGRMAEAQGRFEAALARACSTGARDVEASVLRGLGAVHRQLGHTDQARDMQEAALALYRELGDRLGECIARNNLGLLYLTQGHLDDAGSHFRAALQLSRASADRNTEGDVLGNLALLHSYRGRKDDAAAHYEAALAVHRAVGDRRREGQVLGNLGVAQRAAGHPDEARATYERALELHRDVGNRRFEGMVLGNLGNLHHREGHIEQARQYWQSALAVHQEVDNQGSQAIVLGNLGTLCREEGDLAAARVHCDAALRRIRRGGQRRLLVWLLTLSADLDQLQGAVETAHAQLDEAEAVAQAVGDPVLTTSLHATRAKVLARQGRPDDAAVELQCAQAAAPEGNQDARKAIDTAREEIAEGPGRSAP